MEVVNIQAVSLLTGSNPVKSLTTEGADLLLGNGSSEIGRSRGLFDGEEWDALLDE